MYYPEEVIEEVRSRNDIVDLISSYVNLKRKGTGYFGLCPFHNEKTGSFHVLPSKQIFYCFGCGAGGNAITFIMQYENLSFQEAVQFLAKRAGVALPEREMTGEERARQDRKQQVLEIHKTAATHYYRLLHSAEGARGYAYLTGRGLTEATITRFGLGFSSKRPGELYRFLKEKGYKDDILKDTGLVTIEERGARDKFWNRVMFPILDANSRVIGFGGRVMGDGEPKYLNSPETMIFDKSRNLYGLNYAKSSRKDYFLLCEGYMDVISLHQAGFTNAVASLGTALTPQHCLLLKRYVKEVILTYDSDGAGVNAAKRAIPLLREAGIVPKVLSMKPSKDPDEFIRTFGAEAYEKRISEARNAFLWEADQAAKEYDPDDPAEKTAFYRDIAERLLVFTDPMERGNYLTAVAREHLIPEDELRKAVNALGERRNIRPSYADRERPEPAYRKPKEKDTAALKSQRIFLTFLSDDPSILPELSNYISPEDFTDPLYREIAEAMFRGGAEASPARILSRYADDEEKEKRAAGVFNAGLGEGLDDEERSKALTDCVRHIRTEHLNEELKQAASADDMQRILKEKAGLKTLKIMIRGTRND